MINSQTAVAIYAVMARDPVDALEMIQECEDQETLNLLQAMLTATGGPNTDHELNAIFIGPVQRRLHHLTTHATS